MPESHFFEFLWQFMVAQVRRLAGNLYVTVQGLTNDDFLQIMVSIGDKTWSSDFEKVNDYQHQRKD